MEDLEQQQLTLHLYPPSSGEGAGTLYSDAGDGFGDSRIDRFYLIRHAQDLELVWDRQGNAEFTYQTVQLQVHGLSVQQVWVDDQSVSVRKTQVDRQFERVRWRCSE